MALSPADTPPESILATNSADQPSNQRTKSHAPLSNEERLNAITIQDVSLFFFIWRGHLLLRRIDSDYSGVMFSVLCSKCYYSCRALRKPDLQAEFRELPGAVVVEGNRDLMVNGTWAHLSLVAERAEAMAIPEDLVNVFLDVNLVNRFPRFTEILTAFRRTQRGLPRFGPPFGFSYNRAQNPPPNAPMATTTGIERRLETLHLRLRIAGPSDISASRTRLPPTERRNGQATADNQTDRGSALASSGPRNATLRQPIIPNELSTESTM